MTRTSDSFAWTLGRAAILAVWSWIGLAAVLAFAASSVARESPWAQLDEIVYSSFTEAFPNVLLLNFGDSIWFTTPALDHAVSHVGATLTLVALVALFAAAIGTGFVLLARRAPAAKRALEGGGYVLALPATVWSALLIVAGITGNVHAVGNPSPVDVWPAALALALPIAALVARVIVRDRPTDRTWALDGWLFAVWLVGALAWTESVWRIDGVGSLWFEALIRRDIPLLVASTAILSIPLILASVARELAWHGGDFNPSRERRVHAAEADGGARFRAPSSFVREPRVLAGAVSFVALLLIGTLASEPTTLARADELSLALAGLGMLVPSAIVVLVISAVVGTVIGLLTVAVPRGDLVSGFLLDYVVNAPGVLLFGVVGWTAGLLQPEWGLGLAVAGLVSRAAARDLRAAEGVEARALVPAVGVAAVGAAVATMGLAAFAQLGVTRAPALYVEFFDVTNPVGLPEVARLTVAIGLPVLSLLLVGEGLRQQPTAEPPE